MNDPVRHRILCIEDDPRLRRLLAEDLTEAGYEVSVAADALAGIEAFFEQAPALVLCDIRMPGISGFDLFERLKRLDGTLFGAAFAFLTALADRDNELRGRRLGADDYITKPVDYEILHEVIRIRLSGRGTTPRAGATQADLLAQLRKWFNGPPEDPPAGLARALAAHIARSGGASASAATQDMPSFDRMLSAMPLGVLMIDQAGKIDYINETAASLLGRPRAVLAGSRAVGVLAAFARQHVARAAGHYDRLSAARLLLGADGALTAIAQLARSGEGGAADRVTILLPALPGAQPALAELLHVLFGLTPAERMLATEISGGANLADVAATRGVSQSTVRAQLKSVFGKVGVSRQSDLVRTLLSLQMAVGCAGV